VPNYLLEVDHPLVVPQGVKIRVLLTSADVIHAWWVPDFGIKRDAIPGFINELWFTADRAGTVPRPVRRALRPRPRLHAGGRRSQAAAEFDTWLAAQKQALQASGDQPSRVAVSVPPPAAAGAPVTQPASTEHGT
jgi:cytochrome c oxidase subunit 2